MPGITKDSIRKRRYTTADKIGGDNKDRSSIPNGIPKTKKSASLLAVPQARKLKLQPSLVKNVVLTSKMSKEKWRLGDPLGKGNCGEIFLASNDITKPVTDKSSKFAVKLERHERGTLFVETHCLFNMSKVKGPIKSVKGNDALPLKSTLGIPVPKAAGSHVFGGQRYRFLVLPRFDRDLSTIINDCLLDQKYLLFLAIHLIDALESVHDCGYAHNDIKADNVMVTKNKPSKGPDLESKLVSSTSSRTSKVCDIPKKCSSHSPAYALRSQSSRNMPDDANKPMLLPTRRRFVASRQQRSLDVEKDDKPRKCAKRSDFNIAAASQLMSSDDEEESMMLGKSLRYVNSSSGNWLVSSLISDRQQTQQGTAGDNRDGEHLVLIDFGLANKLKHNGRHRPFIVDERRAHDGTLPFTSRDAHVGAHSRRGDLESLGYNLLLWSQGYLPWQNAVKKSDFENVHLTKEYIMSDVRNLLKESYGDQIPEYLSEFLYHVDKLTFDERPDYARYRSIFKSELDRLGYSFDEMQLNSEEIMRSCIKMPEDKARQITLNVFRRKTRSSLPKITKLKTPIEIARERIEREFNREEKMQKLRVKPCQYVGRPTYAILERQNLKRLKCLPDTPNDKRPEKTRRRKSEPRKKTM